MSSDHTSPLHRHVHARFKDVFGEPNNSLGRDDHWALFPTPKSVSINVLVDGMAANAAVWVFDPHDRKDGIMKIAVQSEEHLEEIIALIQARVDRAKVKGTPGGEVG